LGGDARGLGTDRRAAKAALPSPLAPILTFSLAAGAFPADGHPDVAVHVPPGFDPGRRPGIVLYVHGWNGCATLALAPTDGPCGADDPTEHRSANLAAEIDEAGVNALGVAVELRPAAGTGEPGALGKPAGMRHLIEELLEDRLAGQLGRPMYLDAVDRIVLVAHSGGYQAAAAALQTGDLPQVREVILLDALYAGVEIFTRWVTDDIARFDPRVRSPLRFVDLYTCCAGTARLSRVAADTLTTALRGADLEGALFDGDATRDPLALTDPKRTVVFVRTDLAHSDLPRMAMGALLRSAGFARR
jgi:hypothetical protein